MQRGLVVKTVLVVFFGLVFAAIGLGVRERLWRAGPGDYATELVVPKPAVDAGAPLLAVRIFDSDSNAALAGAEVWVDSGAAQKTNEQGLASFSDIAPGVHTLHVRAEGYAASERQVTIDDFAFVHAFRVQRGVALAGVVRTASGPVPDAVIEVRRLDWHGMLVDSTKTDGAGRFAFEPLQERGVEVSAVKDALRGRVFVQLPDEQVLLELSAAPLRQLKLGDSGRSFAPAFVLPAQLQLKRRVRVLSPDGAALPGARVYVVAKDSPPAMSLFRSGNAQLLGFTDAEGFATIARGTGGCLIAGAWPYAPSAQAPCVDSEPENDATLQVREGAWLSGSFGTKGLLVIERPEGAAAVTGADGGFRIGPLSPGTHAVEVWSAQSELLDAGLSATLAEGEERSL